MPQVFGTKELGLMSEASLWAEAADLQGDPNESDHFGQFLDQEGFQSDFKPPSQEQVTEAKGRLRYSRSLGTKTVKNLPPKTDANGQLLNGDGYHELVVHVDNSVREGARDTSVGGKKRYELAYHHMNRNGHLDSRVIYSGNTPHGLNAAHEKLKAAFGKIRQ